uniref:Uncharacterized protein n=1 Tax=Cucumis melo TaxID=3656 RepID=A0A9I9ELV0_CUCME
MPNANANVAPLLVECRLFFCQLLHISVVPPAKFSTIWKAMLILKQVEGIFEQFDDVLRISSLPYIFRVPQNKVMHRQCLMKCPRGMWFLGLDIFVGETDSRVFKRQLDIVKRDMLRQAELEKNIQKKFRSCTNIRSICCSDKATKKEQSSMNRAAITRQPYNHSSGAKSKTHVWGGQFVSQAAADTHNQMLELRAQSILEGSQPLIGDEICETILDRHSSSPSIELELANIREVNNELKTCLELVEEESNRKHEEGTDSSTCSPYGRRGLLYGLGFSFSLCMISRRTLYIANGRFDDAPLAGSLSMLHRWFMHADIPDDVDINLFALLPLDVEYLLVDYQDVVTKTTHLAL